MRGIRAALIAYAGSYFICSKLDLERTKLREAAIPSLIPDRLGQSTWVRTAAFVHRAPYSRNLFTILSFECLFNHSMQFFRI